MNVLVYGAGMAAKQLVKAIEKTGYIRCVGVIDDAGIGLEPDFDIELVQAAAISEIIKRRDVEEIIIAIAALSPRRRSEILGQLSELEVRVRLLPDRDLLGRDKVFLDDVKNVDLDDLLLRPVVGPVESLLRRKIDHKKILVTGAGGSIGAELVRIVSSLSPERIVLVDHSEHALFRISEEICKSRSGMKPVCYLGSVAEKSDVQRIFCAERPDVVFHAAAYKHVSMVEENISKAFINNVLGTMYCAGAAIENSIGDFVLVSTDKAVRPTNIMGATKRVAEKLIQHFASTQDRTNFCAVRFGNVLGSSGSVVPTFLTQIQEGGPVTVRHPAVTRYFMSIREAAELVIQASALSGGGDIFLLDMGEPVKILDLAKKLVRLTGNTVGQEGIEIIMTGLRPGEKINEELLVEDSAQATQHPKIFRAFESLWNSDNLDKIINIGAEEVALLDDEKVLNTLKTLVEGFER